MKYHKGFSVGHEDAGRQCAHGALAFNPSHLEIVNPVVEGSVRARQQRRGDDRDGSEVLPVLIHGDAAFAGQGVVTETLPAVADPRLPAPAARCTSSSTTRSVSRPVDPRDARSTDYCTDVAKMIEAPVFHVNGDDPEAV